MRARDGAEEHRAATPLELLFDLCFVVAVALAADDLHHALSEGHPEYGKYLMVFFAIWWAWMNVTWFASAYDTDDVPYRLATFTQIAGALTLAAGVPRAFEHDDYAVVTLGYAIMRTALAAQWLRAWSAGDCCCSSRPAAGCRSSCCWCWPSSPCRCGPRARAGRRDTPAISRSGTACSR
jgi:low temperature requirement protein LtrA